jgi:hypothetical protein
VDPGLLPAGAIAGEAERSGKEDCFRPFAPPVDIAVRASHRQYGEYLAITSGNHLPEDVFADDLQAEFPCPGEL